VNLNAGVAGVLDNGDTYIFGTGVDRITDLASGEGMSFQGAQYQNLPNIFYQGTASTNGEVSDQKYMLVQGNFNTGTNTFTVDATATGHDTLVVYDGNASVGSVTQTGVVLSGVTLAQLQAYTSSNWLEHA
jgi:hypothetical protein